MSHSFPKHGIFQGKEDFDALIKVPRHPISASKVDFLLSSIMEVEDSAVLQETTDNATDANMVADSADARTQRTHSANDQVDVDTCLRRTIKRHDHVLVKQRVHFGDDVCGASMSCVFRFPIDESDTIFSEVQRRHHQGIIGRVLRISCKETEDI